MSLRNIAIVGAGGLGKEIAVLIHQINQKELTWNVVGFYDDTYVVGKRIATHLVLGKVAELNKVDYPLDVVIAIGDPAIKSAVVSKIKNHRLTFPALIHPDTTIGSGVQLGIGSIITAGCRLTIDIHLGEHVLVNLNTTIGHDVAVGNYSSIMPGAHLSGHVQLGTCVMIGTGASILQNIKIGDNAKVGACALVTSNVQADTTVIGIPARQKI